MPSASANASCFSGAAHSNRPRRWPFTIRYKASAASMRTNAE